MNQNENGLHRLAMLIGSWRTEGKILNDKGETTGKITGRDTYEWVLDRKFILHHVDVMMDNEHTMAIELINSVDTDFELHSFDNSGAHAFMKGSIDEQGMFTITGEGMRAELNVTEEGKGMEASWEKQSDTKEWQKWMIIKFSRI